MSDDYHAKLVAAGHVLKRDEDGSIDIFVCDTGNHNGPGCDVCDDSWCHHCQGEIKPCDGGERKRAREAKRRMEAASPSLVEQAQELDRLAVVIESALWKADDLANHAAFVRLVQSNRAALDLALNPIKSGGSL